MPLLFEWKNCNPYEFSINLKVHSTNTLLSQASQQFIFHFLSFITLLGKKISLLIELSSQIDIIKALTSEFISASPSIHMNFHPQILTSQLAYNFFILIIKECLFFTYFLKS